MPNPSPAENPGVQYEHCEAYVGRVLAILGVVGLLAAPFFYVVWLFLAGIQRDQAAAKQMDFPLAQEPSHRLPPEPRLESLPPQETEMRDVVPPRVAVRNEQLHEYGKTDDADFVSVPIERAIEYLAEKLPVRKPSDQPSRPDSGLVDAGEPNSGRVLRKGSR